jgi:hypothetical protein
MFDGPGADVATSSALRASVSYALEPGGDRAAELEQLLTDLLRQWQLPARADRYAASAAGALDRSEALELFVQVDRVSQLLTLELWSAGQFRYGLDDWVG